MKKIFTFIIVLFCCFVNAQQSATISLDWDAKTAYSIGDVKLNIPQFSSDSFNFDFANKSLFYIKKIPTDYFVDESSLQITNVVFESVSETQLGNLSQSEIKKSITASVKTIVSRDQYFGYLTFSPIIKEESGYKRVKSLTYSFARETNASKITSNNSVATITNSALASGTWKRIYVQKWKIGFVWFLSFRV